MTDRLPNLFIAGVPKAGTSALHRWLADHPDVLGARDKEARFFVDRHSHIYDPDCNVENGFDGYRQQFDLAPGTDPRVLLDSTPAYIYQRAALDHIPDLPGRPNCIFVLREPAEQILSVFRYYQNNWSYIPHGWSFAQFLTAVDHQNHLFGGNELASNAVANAEYVTFLRQWRDRLGADRMLIVLFDDLRRDPAAVCGRIANWVGITDAFYDDYGFPSENESYVARSRLLQRANIAVRDRLPKGRAYRLLRQAYRRLNTGGAGADVQTAALADLRRRFADANRALAAEFSLDLSGWER